MATWTSILLLALCCGMLMDAHAGETTNPPTPDLPRTPASAPVSPISQKEADQLIADGRAAMQDAIRDRTRAVAAAVDFSRAVADFEAHGMTDRADDLEANIYWCTKNMSVDDITAYIAQRLGDVSVTEALAKAQVLVAKDVPQSEATSYFNRAEAFAKNYPDDFGQIAAHYFEVAGSEVSLKAQKLSLEAQQHQLTQLQTDTMAERRTLFTRASGVMPSAELKAPVPSPEQLRSALMELRKIYKDDYARNKQPNQKRLLTAKMLDLGSSTKDDPVFRFALLTEVVDLASATSDWYAVITAIDLMSEHYTGIDPLARKKEVVGRFHANPTVAAVLKLLDHPEDPDANTLIGRSLCLEWGNWESGCQLLARGNDADFKVAAEMEVARPSVLSEQLELGDQWYALGRKSRPGVKEVVLARANVWYRHVQPLLGGITRERIAQRSDEIAAVVAKVDGAAALGGSIIPDLAGSPWAAVRGKDQFGAWADLTVAGATQRLRLIKPGTFLMGSPPSEMDRVQDEVQHKVTLTKPCWMADSPCTQALWTAVMGKNPSHFHGDQLPVESVSWDDCMRFIHTLNSKIPFLGARMPTEAEWEYACRGGFTTAYAGGSLDDMAWIARNADQSTHAVRQKKPNPWGIFDMHGNVWEPCSDVYGPYEDGPQTDPVGSHAGDNRVIRGGAWDLTKEYGRSARRGQNAPGNFGAWQGLRICISSSAP
jgi:formylglycine-generating enzyme required for sulfatase activity